MDRGAWWNTVHGFAQSQTQVKRLSMQAHSIPYVLICTQIVKSISHIVSVRVSSLDGYKPTILPLKVLVLDFHVFLLFTFPILFFLSLSPTAYFLSLILFLST